MTIAEAIRRHDSPSDRAELYTLRINFLCDILAETGSDPLVVQWISNLAERARNERDPSDEDVRYQEDKWENLVTYGTKSREIAE
ncbi:MAG: hypothetical protein IJV65_08865 [Kiritimatiellae bacterium]|nr:hypothetical protein [Kiritimatiellia bacterium]